jgi:hypothetical protein
VNSEVEFYVESFDAALPMVFTDAFGLLKFRNLAACGEIAVRRESETISGVKKAFEVGDLGAFGMSLH